MNQPYVYRLTDLQTGTRYIGMRYAKGCHPHELGVSYFTSSNRVKPLFKADPKRFECQIVTTGARDYVIKVEKSLIDFYDAMRSENFYNRTDNHAIHPEDSKRGGLRGGAKNAKTGHMSELGKNYCGVGGLVGGKITGALNKASGAAFRLARTNNSKKYACLTCGLVSTTSGVGRHQQVSGHSGRKLSNADFRV